MTMNKLNGEVQPKAAKPYHEIRGSKLNRSISILPRVLICVLAVMMFLVFTNPAQTAMLGRATHMGLALFGDGLDELREADKQIDASVNTVDKAVDALNKAADGLTTVGVDMAAAKNALKAAQDAKAAADAALAATLGVEAAAQHEILTTDMSAATAYLATAAEKLQSAVDAYEKAAADESLAMDAENAMYEAMSPFWDISGNVPDMAEAADNIAMALSDVMWYEPATEEDPTKAEKIAATLADAQAQVAALQQQVTELEAKKAAATEVLGRIEPAMTAASDALATLDGALTAANDAVTAASDAKKKSDKASDDAEAAKLTEEQLQSASAALTETKDAMLAAVTALQEVDRLSAITNAQLADEQSGMLQISSVVYALGVAVGLVGMVMSFGNNRMRKQGFVILTAGAAVNVICLILMNGALGAIADRAAVVATAYGDVVMPEVLSSAIAKLALDTPDALWVCLVMNCLAALSALAAWLTLPKQLEDTMQIDLLTIFQRLTRVLILVTGMMVFFPSLNPGRISVLINENTSLFTVATSYGTITDKMQYALDRGIVDSSVFTMLMIGAAIVVLGIVLNAAGACMSLGNNRMKKKGGYLLPMAGSMAIIVGLIVIFFTYNALVQVTVKNPSITARIQPMLPGGIAFWAVSAVLIFISSFVSWYLLPDELEEKMEMDERYRNFLMFLPVLLLTFIFCYLPIWGWRFAFFDYKIGDQMLLYDTVVDGVVTQESNYTGLKWFVYLFENPANRDDLIRVLRNTLVMSGLGIATSWLPIAFAVLLAEVRSSKFQRVVQTLTTIPNFISWVLVYAIAFAIFSTDGFVNSFLRNVMGIAGANTDYLASADWIWVKMLLWGTWKGLGWSAIVYIAGIAGIDQQLYEAARVDGANRFQCIRHITIPGLMPTYMVMLLMSVAGMLSNGMDQYLVFENAINKDVIEVLDLYVYNIGIKSELYPLSTVVGVFKSLIGVTLLFGANGISKALRGESII